MCSMGNCDDWPDFAIDRVRERLYSSPTVISDAPSPRIKIGRHNSFGSKPPIVRFYSHADTCDPNYSSLSKKQYKTSDKHWEKYEDNNDGIIYKTHGEEVCETTLFWRFSREETMADVSDTMHIHVPDSFLNWPKLPCGDIVIKCIPHSSGEEWSLYVDNHALECGGETARYHKVTIACPGRDDL